MVVRGGAATVTTIPQRTGCENYEISSEREKDAHEISSANQPKSIGNRSKCGRHHNATTFVAQNISERKRK